PFELRRFLAVGIGSLEEAGELERGLASRPEVDPEWLEIGLQDSGDQPDLQPAIEHLIDNGDFLEQANWMVQWRNMSHCAEADAFGAGAGRDRVEIGRRHPAFTAGEVVLDAKAVIETERVAEHELAPKLLVTLARRHAGFHPDM